MFNLFQLFEAAHANYEALRAQADQKFGRLMGKHVRARILRAQAKRVRAGKTPFNPA